MHLKDSWPESGLLGGWGRWANQVSRLFNGATGYDGAQVFLAPQGLQVYGSAAGLDLSLFAFGISSIINEEGGPTRVGTNAGIVFMGSSNIVVEAVSAQHGLEVSGGSSFAIIRANRHQMSAQWIVASSVPADTPMIVHRPYYEFRKAVGALAASLYRVHRVGNLEIP